MKIFEWNGNGLTEGFGKCRSSEVQVHPGCLHTQFEALAII